MSLFRPLASLLAVLALAAPAARAAEDWLHDPLDDSRWWLFAAGALTFEPVPGKFGSRAPGQHWVRRDDGAPAHVVYFVPGLLRGIEIDTHRRLDAAGDFELWLSADGLNYRRWDVPAQALETVGEWEFRLLEVVELPPGYSHALVRFPDSATPETHRLSEVWIRFLWIEAAAPAPLPQPSPASLPLVLPAAVAVGAPEILPEPAAEAETIDVPTKSPTQPAASPEPAAAEPVAADSAVAEHAPNVEPAVVLPAAEPVPSETPRRTVGRKKIGPRSK